MIRVLGIGPIQDLVDASHVPWQIGLGDVLVAHDAEQLRMLRRPLAAIGGMPVVIVPMTTGAVGATGEVVFLSGLGWEAPAALGTRNL